MQYGHILQAVRINTSTRAARKSMRRPVNYVQTIAWISISWLVPVASVDKTFEAG
ncbi:hypothetical protein [Nonomuraea basaltis]|uniref:hypothetical protein n=1 Tax=Nonomuraea basaltis TaxID=2495887 RepID=UPI001486045F|nr:hypothetical protein [Nonomuraea basaltis]